MSLMVGDLFELSRIHAGALALRPQPVSGDLVSEALAGADPVARRRASRRGRGSAGAGRVDPAGMSPRAGEPLINAIRQTPADGTVHVLAGGRGRIVLAVTDGCGGIARRCAPRLRRRLPRHSARPQSPRARTGAGLGLAIVKGHRRGPPGPGRRREHLSASTSFVTGMPLPGPAPLSLRAPPVQTNKPSGQVDRAGFLRRPTVPSRPAPALSGAVGRVPRLGGRAPLVVVAARVLTSLAPARRRTVLGVVVLTLVSVVALVVTLVARREPPVDPLPQGEAGPVLLVPGYGGSTAPLERANVEPSRDNGSTPCGTGTPRSCSTPASRSERSRSTRPQRPRLHAAHLHAPHADSSERTRDAVDAAFAAHEQHQQRRLTTPKGPSCRRLLHARYMEPLPGAIAAGQKRLYPCTTTSEPHRRTTRPRSPSWGPGPCRAPVARRSRAPASAHPLEAVRAGRGRDPVEVEAPARVGEPDWTRRTTAPPAAGTYPSGTLTRPERGGGSIHPGGAARAHSTVPEGSAPHPVLEGAVNRTHRRPPSSPQPRPCSVPAAVAAGPTPAAPAALQARCIRRPPPPRRRSSSPPTACVRTSSRSTPSRA